MAKRPKRPTIEDVNEGAEKMLKVLFPPEGHFACINCNEVFPNEVKKTREVLDMETPGSTIALEYCPQCFAETCEEDEELE